MNNEPLPSHESESDDSKKIDQGVFEEYQTKISSFTTPTNISEDRVQGINDNLWMMESIFGREAIAERKVNGVLEKAAITELFTHCTIPFYVSKNKKMILNHTSNIVSKYGPFEQITALEAIIRFPIECVEESLEKGLSYPERFSKYR